MKIKNWLKLEVKVKLNHRRCLKLDIIKKGDWVDLSTPYDVTLFKNHDKNYCIIPLGVAMKLPKGLEAVVVPRSSTYKNYGITMANSIGIIDNTYCGNNDQWGFPAISYKDTIIPANSRIAQFRIQLSQHATIWNKLRWLFSNGIVFTYVDTLDNSDRGGFGSTGQ